jgi:hypothetical protein
MHERPLIKVMKNMKRMYEANERVRSLAKKLELVGTGTITYFGWSGVGPESRGEKDAEVP